MHVVAGLELGGATLTPRDDGAQPEAWLGDVVWSPLQLLSDLELRLGLARHMEPTALRLASWQERLARHVSPAMFYVRSFAADPLGTAQTLLALRDSLVEAGWEGEDVPGGGARLEALTELERCPSPALSAGYCDRLRAVERALSVSSHRIYDDIALAEPASHWAQRWRRIFDSLERAGTRITRSEPVLPGASRESDLQRVQAALEKATDVPARIEGDGSFVLLTAETSWEAAHATAAILSNLDPARTAVIREGDGSALDYALSALGLPALGHRAKSPWRAALQILPLALELAFEPKDPYRVLELLGVPGGPFQGRAGRRLARALARAPGVGSPDWEKAKAELTTNRSYGANRPANDTAADDTVADGVGAETGAIDAVADAAAADEILRRIQEWLEKPGADPLAGASKAMLLTIVDRVRDWLLWRIAASPGDGALLAAASSAAAFRMALEREPREHLDLLAVRKLAAMIRGDGDSAQLLREQSGRFDHVDRATKLVAVRPDLVWWFFADTVRRPPRLPWRQGELRALSTVGVRFPDQRARLLELSRQRRRALRCATERVILVAPRACSRDRLAADPLWHEIVGSARLDEAARDRLTLHARALRSHCRSGRLLHTPRLVPLARSPLPGGHLEWNTKSAPRRHGRAFSSTALSALLSCPLRWVLSYAAGLRSARLDLPRPHQLAGTLGHRLVEELHARGALDGPEVLAPELARGELERLIASEGALLLRAGMSFERSQVTEQLVTAVTELSRSLRRAKLRIVAVEQSFRMPWRGAELEGRVDLLVAGPDGTQYIVDLKWGATSYRADLKDGRALQLAAYAALGGSGREQPIEAAFFTLKRAKLIGLSSSTLPIDDRVSGPSLSTTWAALERSMECAEGALARGRIAVSGLRRSLPLLDALGVEPSEQSRCFAAPRDKACEHCDFDAICGRRWEVSHGRG